MTRYRFNNLREVEKDGKMVVRLDPDALCATCRNSTLVLLDSTDAAAPCPHCEGGLKVEESTRWPWHPDVFWTMQRTQSETFDSGRSWSSAQRPEKLPQRVVVSVEQITAAATVDATKLPTPKALVDTRPKRSAEEYAAALQLALAGDLHVQGGAS